MRPIIYIFGLVFSFLIIFSPPTEAQENTDSTSVTNDTSWVQKYKKKDIVDARYGSGDIQTLIQKAQQIPSSLNKVIVGQKLATQALGDRVVQYLEGFPGRTREPVALNLIGLPGIGKSAMMDELKKMGFNVVQIDVQSFAENPTSFASDLMMRLNSTIAQKKPVILVIDEIDKVPELNSERAEKTSTIIGQINQALAEGRITTPYGGEIRLSNVMIVTTMNLSPQDIEAFSEEVLKEKKSFYDFSIENFQKFDEWIKSQPAARYKVLSRLFRSNTISRLAPNTLIMSPFNKESYKELTRIYADKAVNSFLQKTGSNKMAKITIDQSLIDFLAEKTAFAPSGARETVAKVNALIEQLSQFSMKLDGGDPEALGRPRSVTLSYDHNSNEALISVISYVWANKQANQKSEFQERIKFNDFSGLFEMPSNLVLEKPAIQYKTKDDLSKKIKESRFPKAAAAVKNITPVINKIILGQEEAVLAMTSDFGSYMARVGPAQKEPSARVFIGFPGIGKSDLFNLAGQTLDLPIVRINMQQFSAAESEAVTNFAASLAEDVQQARTKRPDGKYILLIEELDKVYEINPQNGSLVNRPVMGLVKDILNDGRFTLKTENRVFDGDFRDAFIGVTMNFAVDRFGFKADPRLTTIDDVLSAWKRIKSTPADLKDMLMSMFLPETVSRLMSRMFVMKPLSKENYEEVIARQLEKVVTARLKDREGNNISQIEVELSDRYKQLLSNETVIPSEGARNTVTMSQKMISMDLEYALSKLPKKAKYATEPLKISFDYDPATAEVLAKVQITSDKNDTPIMFAKRQVALQFPPVTAHGKISEERLKTSLHEFGHAYVGALLGLRFESVVVVSPQAGIGGFVKFTQNGQTAYSMMAQIYSMVASRAMERIYLSPDPKSQNSVMDITSGPSQDILMATKLLYSMLYQLGMDPSLGTMERMGVEGPARYANFEDLNKNEVDRLGQILRKMENSIVDDILSRHSKTWLTNRITKLAQAGAMSEKEFYKLIEMKLPAPGSSGLVIKNAEMKKSFEKIIIDYDQESANKKGSDHRSVVDNANKYKNNFLNLLKGDDNGTHGLALKCSALFH